MASSPGPGPAPRGAREPEPDLPWVREGILAGLLGAAAVAILFFVVDVAHGRPLWTPNALGTALFLGQVAPPDARISPALIGGYTVIHGWVFLSIALIVAALVSTSDWARGRRGVHAVVLAGALFVACNLVFLVFALLRGPDAARPFSLLWLMATNAFAAVVMAVSLAMRLERPAR